MRLPLPRSLTGQTIAVLVLTLLISHLIGITFYSADRSKTVMATEARDFAEWAVGMVTLLEHLPEQWRGDVVREADGRTSFHIALGASADRPGPAIEEAMADEVASFIRRQLPEWRPERIAVAFVTAPAANGVDELVTLHIAMRLTESAWLNFVGPMSSTGSVWLTATSAYMLTVVIAVGTAAMWLVLRATSPFAAFARAADRLGRDIRADPLPESGPSEVALASRAFNAMQERLRRLVENRTQILAALSHDLKTPVTLLRLRAEQMGEGDDRDRILKTLDEMEMMISSVLEFAQATLLGELPRDVELGALVGSVCDDLADAGAAIEFIPAPQLRYPCRRIALKRALTNLVENAVKYGGGARVALQGTTDAVLIVVDDEGPGIPPDKFDMVFMPFYRLDEARSEGGVGLGLSIAQAIVQGHGGDIRLENRAEGGLRVSVSLPRSLQHR